MGSRIFLLNDPEIREIQAFINKTKSKRLRTRLLGVLLYGTNVPVDDILEQVGYSRSTLMNWCAAYKEQGIQGLFDNRNGGNNAKLSKVQVRDLRRRLQGTSPFVEFGRRAATDHGEHWTIEDLYTAVKQWYGVVYDSRSSYHRLFANCGFTYYPEEDAFRPRFILQEQGGVGSLGFS